MSLSAVHTRLEPSARLADVIVALSGADPSAFGPALLAWFSEAIRFDHSVVFAYRGDARPPCLFETFNRQDSHVFVALYQDGPYRLDPFCQTALARRSGFWRMRELAPDRFYASEYFRTYYEKTGLAEEVGFFVPMESGVTVVLSLMRLKRSRAFSAVEIRELRRAAPLVMSLVRLAWGDTEVPEQRVGMPDLSGQHASREEDLGVRAAEPPVMEKSLLTTRESQVVDLVLQGHSSDSIADRLGMTPGTVKVHRRNIYRKLHISSQAELFAWFVAQNAK
ncbi:Transcriptional regulatory protein UhpA [Hartmannibacter diazotrophicus]|uniref:Transcriptional regulatory protein UhpA n=1 Tax=Hartmannibacter diazotrophicus TaxID=1482074 RepID=A0A2C9DAX5_9HYPH|nr:helix-turn-helix transcriptional regulator [Hartmannibacter diazotrophicus]SON56755.1 Transcriptional regulatory protein UhpA [Hartmannibacter diazotrophicus]